MSTTRPEKNSFEDIASGAAPIVRDFAVTLQVTREGGTSDTIVPGRLDLAIATRQLIDAARRPGTEQPRAALKYTEFYDPSWTLQQDEHPQPTPEFSYEQQQVIASNQDHFRRISERSDYSTYSNYSSTPQVIVRERELSYNTT